MKQQDGTIAFLESLNEDHPGCTFSVTPAIYLKDIDEIRRGILVRLPSGELRKLRRTLNREQIQDTEVIRNPVVEDFEAAILEELRSAIRKEMKLII